MQKSPLTIGFWAFEGRGEPLRLLCEYTGLPYENKLYTSPSESFTMEKLALNSDFPNLPFHKHGEKIWTETEPALGI